MLLKKLLIPAVFLFTALTVFSAENTVSSNLQLEESANTKITKAPNIELLQLIPLVVMLESQLENLKNEKPIDIDASALNRQYVIFEERLAFLKQKLDDSSLQGENNYATNFRLKKEIQATQADINKAMEPLDSVIKRFDEKSKEWLEIKKKWQIYQEQFNHKQSIFELDSTFENKDKTIENAFQFIKQNINEALLLQTKGSLLSAVAERLIRKLNNEIANTRDKYIENHSSPLYLSDFYQQFNIILWHTIVERLEMFSLPSLTFYIDHGYFTSLIALLVVVFLVLIFRNREALEASEYLNFIAKRPISFLAFFTTLIIGVFLNLNEAPEVNQLVNKVIGTIAIVRTLTLFVESKWRVQVCYWAMTSYIFMLIIFTAGMPYPVIRLIIILLSIFAFVACIRCIIREQNNQQSITNLWLVKLELLIFTVILIAEFWGRVNISSLIFISLLKLLSIFIPLALFSRIMEKGIRWLFFGSPVWEIKLMRSEASVLVDKVSFFVNLIIAYYLFLPAALSVLNVYDSFADGYQELSNMGFYIGNQWIAVNTIVTSFVVLYLTLLISKIFPMVCLDEAIIGKKIERGVRISMGRLIQYFIVLVGFIFALSSFGTDMAQLTIIFSALSVGIGFGLQGLSKDFISGLFLLFERPLREGDIIEVNNMHARIKSIGLRSTVAMTYEEAEVIIPNGSLIESQVINWTLSSKELRMTLNIGVVYNSNVPLVISTLNNCSQADARVLKSPAPSVMLVSFGDNALMFELRIWIDDVDAKFQIRSNIYLEIERQFRENGIEFAFPQLVIHQHENKSAASKDNPSIKTNQPITDDAN